ncbi:sensor histidine kinase [Streptomyces sp. MST-110588]|uniref:sensor histidine kinase n=1 Tax=Streptomyces sp. MST-110588 TaxID=2833628 RepID=UPI001F5D41A0|nr:sensor histidine kinase [Streptomyces sp. MST-110588]UNO39479.1 sensor histidine kinase [Streptomyces sp. MST-110588]
MEEQPAGLAGPGHEWLRGYAAWDCYYALAFAGVIVFTLTLEDSTASSPSLACGLLLCCALWYAAYGRALMRTEDQSRRGLLYLGALFVLFAAADAFASAASLSLVAIVPQAYWTLRPLHATGAVAVFATAPVAVDTFRTGSVVRGIADQGPTALAVILFSAIFGTWAHRIIDQSSERARLIQELAATRAELAEVAEQAGAAAERERLAGEIHDAIAQGLSSIVMLLQAAGTALDRLTGLPEDHGRSVDRARHQLGLAAHTAREGLAEAGALVEALRPTALDAGAGSLPEALRRLTDRAAQGGGPTVHFSLSGEPEALPVAVEVVLLRVTQEALANARKHARASSVDVTLGYTEDSVFVRVCDDGAGFDPEEVAGGYGLIGMVRRVEQVGGTRRLDSVPGGGPRSSWRCRGDRPDHRADSG